MKLVCTTTAAIAPLLLLLACSEPSQNQAAPTMTVQPTAAVISMGDFPRAEMQRINAATFGTLADAGAQTTPAVAQSAQATTPSAPVAAPEATPAAEPTVPANVRYDAALVRTQTLLDRAHFSPGVIDGYTGENMRKAISAYQSAHHLDVTGRADAALLQSLANADSQPALKPYVITAADVQGPFADVPETDLEAMSHLTRLGYESAAEGLAEKFHMDEDLLRTLNPGVDFTSAGAEILVTNAGGDLDVAVATIEVDKDGRAVRAYDAQDNLVAFYPATIGSSDAPAPSGSFQVRAIAFDPIYHYDPARLPTFGHRDHGRLEIPPGPNNPVGSVWIALNIETYGIHGAPNPQLVSKTASHGCVRLTNWDAQELGHAVRAGVPVNFIERTADARVFRNQG